MKAPNLSLASLLVTDLDAWMHLAQHLGLAPDRARRGRGASWSRTTDAVTLVFEVTPLSPRVVELRVFVECSAPVFVVPLPQALTTHGRMTTGDIRFDADVYVDVVDASWLGCLDAASRDTLRDVTALGGALVGGTLSVPHAALDTLGSRGFEALLERMCACVGRLQMTDDARTSGIVAIARADPDPGVRDSYRARFAADEVVRHHAAALGSGDPVAVNRAALLDPWSSLATRTAALQALFKRPGLRELAPSLPEIPPELLATTVAFVTRSLASGAITPPVGLLCVAYLDHHAEMITALRVSLFRALGGTRDASLAAWLGAACEAFAEPVFRAAMTALMRLDMPGPAAIAGLSPKALERAVAVAPSLVFAARDESSSASELPFGADVLATLYPRVVEALRLRYIGRVEGYDLCRQYLVALAEVGDARHAQLACAALGSEDEALRMTAVEALSVLGGPSHVAVLEAFGRDLPRAQRVYVRAAIDAIQARIGGGRGGLALADDDALGRLQVHEPKSDSDA